MIVLIESFAWTDNPTIMLPNKPGWALVGTWSPASGVQRPSESIRAGGVSSTTPGAWLRAISYRNGARPRLTCGAAYRIPAPITQPTVLLAWLSGGQYYTYLALAPAGAVGGILQTELRLYRFSPAAGALGLVATSGRLHWHWDSDHYLEAQLAAGAAGGVEVRLDGRTVLQWRGDPGGAVASPPTAYDAVQFGGTLPGQPDTPPPMLASAYLVDDVGAAPTAPIQPTGFLGPCVVAYRPPSQLVAGGWSVVGADNGLNAVREIWLDTGSYIASSDSVATNTYRWADLLSETPYLGVQLQAASTVAASGAQLAFAYNGTELWTVLVPQGAYGVPTVVWPWEPTTGIPWTGARIANAQIRLRNRFGSTDMRVAQLGLEVAYSWNPPHTRRPWVVQANWADTTDATRWDQPYGEILGERLQRVEIERDLAYPQVQVDTCTITTEDPQWIVVPGRKESPLFGGVRFGVKARVFAHGPAGPVPQFYGEITDYQIALDGPPWRLTVRLESPLRQALQTNVDIGQWRIGQDVARFTTSGALTPDCALARLLDSVQLTGNAVVGAEATFKKDWSGRGTFGSLLAELLQMLRWAAYIDPAPTSGDWTLVIRPAAATTTPMATWDWRQGALHPTPQVDYGGEIP
jgi:hypothetical protein